MYIVVQNFMRKLIEGASKSWLVMRFTKFNYCHTHCASCVSPEEFPAFKKWIEKPEANSLLTAGFPNELVLVLSKDKVQAAMQLAKQTLLQEWAKIGDLVFDELQTQRH